jgi:hypothetical protein
MNIAIGYRWFESSAGYHLHRGLVDNGARVSFVGIQDGAFTGWPGMTEHAAATPDAYVWIDPAGRYFPPGIEAYDMPTACYLIDAHLGRWRDVAARFFDIVFLAQKRYVEPFKHLLGHEQVYWLPLAAADDVHVDHGVPRVYDIGFVGNIDRAHVNTPRARRLQLLAERYSMHPARDGQLSHQVGRAYSESKLVFNTSIAGDVTMRLFEGAACGAAVLTDPIAPENGGDALFTPGVELVVYRDDADLTAQVDALLADDARRERIAAAGKARVLAEHTYRHRARRMLDVLQTPGLRRCAPLRMASADAIREARLHVFTHLHMLDAVFDETRGMNPVRRLWRALPGLARRVRI